MTNPKTKQELIIDAAYALFLTPHGCEMPKSELFAKARQFVEEMMLNGGAYRPMNHDLIAMELHITKANIAESIAKIKSLELELKHCQSARDLDILGFAKVKQENQTEVDELNLKIAKLQMLSKAVIGLLNPKHSGDFVKRLEELK